MIRTVSLHPTTKQVPIVAMVYAMPGALSRGFMATEHVHVNGSKRLAATTGLPLSNVKAGVHGAAFGMNRLGRARVTCRSTGNWR